MTAVNLPVARLPRSLYIIAVKRVILQSACYTVTEDGSGRNNLNWKIIVINYGFNESASLRDRWYIYPGELEDTFFEKLEAM